MHIFDLPHVAKHYARRIIGDLLHRPAVKVEGEQITVELQIGVEAGVAFKKYFKSISREGRQVTFWWTERHFAPIGKM